MNKYWFLSKYVAQIVHRKMTAQDQGMFSRATVHDSWQQAHSALLTRLQERMTKAEKELAAAKRAYAKARGMKEPTP